MSEFSYKDSYNDGDGGGWILPDFLASVYERGAVDFVVLDSKTGELLTRKYMIAFADSKAGYFVERKKTNQGLRYVAHYNPNIQIIKTEEFYEETEEAD